MPEPSPVQPIWALDPSPALPVRTDPGGVVVVGGFVATTTDEYSIRLARWPGLPCAECTEPTGTGPIGYLASEPICDDCLLAGCHELGMVLAVISAARRFARSEPGSGESRDALEELGEVAWRYEEVAADIGPPRTVDLP